MTNWFDYFKQRMSQKGVKDFKLVETGSLPPEGTPERVANEFEFDKVLYELEVSKKIRKGHKAAVLWCDKVVCGDQSGLENGVDVGYSIGLSVSAQDNFDFMYDLLGDKAICLSGFGSAALLDPSRMRDDDISKIMVSRGGRSEEVEGAQVVIDKLTDVFIGLQRVCGYR